MPLIIRPAKSIGGILEEFRDAVVDFEATLFTLECLKNSWNNEELWRNYPENVRKKAWNTLCQFADQYVEELSHTALWMGRYCTGSAERDGNLSIEIPPPSVPWQRRSADCSRRCRRRRQ